MSSEFDLIYNIKRKMLAKYPRFGSEIATSNIEFRDDLKYHTAATDGKNIYVDPNYFTNLSENDKLFTIAHEIMHIKFMHMYRLMDKDGKKRDSNLWNIATDAIINANLERDGFKIKEGYINIPEALNYSAEELYQILLQDKERQNTYKNKIQDDDHSLWEQAFEERQRQRNKRKEKNSKKQENVSKDERQVQAEGRKSKMIFDERGEFEENRKEKREKFKSKCEKVKKDILQQGTQRENIELGNIGESKKSIDWKFLLRRETERTETIWSQRRSIAENNYAYRLEENDIEDDAETEIMIDISSSVDLELVKAFLRQVKPVLKQSKLKVGCFNEKFWGFVDINNKKDIDNFTIPEEAREYYAWTEDWDLAVRSFTKKREINKIVFTDGYPCPGTMPKEDLKRENVIWLVYGNKDFRPCCGKVINITERQIEQFHQIDNETYTEDIDS